MFAIKRPLGDIFIFLSCILNFGFQLLVSDFCECVFVHLLYSMMAVVGSSFLLSLDESWFLRMYGL